MKAPPTRKKLDDYAVAITARSMSDLAYMARVRLKVRSKTGEIIPLIFNREQLYLDHRAEEQIRLTGKVRIIVLKGRQQGISTYIEARFYWRTSHLMGKLAYIMTHHQDATDNLFKMAERFLENDFLPPDVGASNAKELIFDSLESGYKVGTAGTKAVGRSATIQYCHNSEFAFWTNADDHFAGLMQAVPNEPGTEIFIESTANGMGNSFHKKCQDAVKGESEYELVFIPWFWNDGYLAPLPEEFKLDEEETEYRDQHDLPLERMAWRRLKIKELGSAQLFKQEYPATIDEAFQAGDFESYISSELAAKSRKRAQEPTSPIMAIGCDPAESPTGDRYTIARRAGDVILSVERHRGVKVMQIVARLAEIYEEDRKNYKKVVIFVDVIGMGTGVAGRLEELDYPVVRVNAGASIPKPPELHGGDKKKVYKPYSNKRAEMAYLLREWMEDGGSIPDSDELHIDMVALGSHNNSNNQLVLESKKDAKRLRGIKSTDLFDACCYTFAEPIHLPKEKKRTSKDKWRDWKKKTGQKRRSKSFMGA